VGAEELARQQAAVDPDEVLASLPVGQAAKGALGWADAASSRLTGNGATVASGRDRALKSKISRKDSGLFVRPAWIAGVLQVLRNFSARWVRTSERLGILRLQHNSSELALRADLEVLLNSDNAIVPAGLDHLAVDREDSECLAHDRLVKLESVARDKSDAADPAATDRLVEQQLGVAVGASAQDPRWPSSRRHLTDRKELEFRASRFVRPAPCITRTA